MQVSALIYTTGREEEHVYKSFTLADGDDAKFDVILAKFDEHFVPKRNIFMSRHVFTKGSKSKERQSNRLYEVFTN